MMVGNCGRLICLLLAVSAVVASVNDEAKFESVVMVNKDVVITDSKFAWLPTEEMRASWGSREGASGKWGFVSTSAPYSPVSHVSGSVYSILDGDNTTGFTWEAVSQNEECPEGSINCVEDGDVAR